MAVQGGNGFKLEELIEDGEILAQAAQRGGGWPISGNIQGQVEWNSEQPDLVEDAAAHGRRVGLNDL